MHIERFDPRADGERLRACHEILVAGHPRDDPTAPPMSAGMFRAWWAYGFTDDPRQVWLATDSSGPVGCYLLELPERENARVAVCLPVVTPAARRRGVGTALLAHCGKQARGAGRARLTSHARLGSAGEAFARAAGARGGLTDVRRVLEVDDELPGLLTRLRRRAEPAAAGYRLISWPGPTPDEHLAPVAALVAAMADAPRADSMEAEQWDAVRVRQTEDRSVAHGLALHSVAARLSRTGELAALTQVATDPATPEWAFQQLTVVARGHRGRRLGLLVKVAMYQWLADLEPGIRHVFTENAEANQHMIAINEQLGFRIADKFRQWDLDLGKTSAPRTPSAPSVPGVLAPASAARPDQS